MSPRASSQPARRKSSGRVWSGQVADPKYSYSLERGAAILQLFTSERPVLGIADIAEGLGMHRSTTHRYVSTLARLGFLEQMSDRKYRLSRRAFDLGMAALEATGLRERAHEHLLELRDCTGYTASIAVLDGSDVLYVDRVPSGRHGEHELGLNIGAGSRLPAYCTALGKVLIAGLPVDERRGLVAGIELRRRGPYTITGETALRNEVESVADGGIGMDGEECVQGLVAIALPVRDERGQVAAAVALEAPAQAISLKELGGTFAPHLAATADLISGRLGYRRADEVGQ